MRQRVVLESFTGSKVRYTDDEGSVLGALECKGVVMVHHNQGGGNAFYTWTLTDLGRTMLDRIWSAQRSANSNGLPDRLSADSAHQSAFPN